VRGSNGCHKLPELMGGLGAPCLLACPVVVFYGRADEWCPGVLFACLVLDVWQAAPPPPREQRLNLFPLAVGSLQ